MQKLLITGASGFLGWHLCQLAQQNWEVYGTYHTQPATLPGATLLPIDLTDSASVRSLFQTLQPDAVIHAAAISSPNLCQSDPERSHRMNVIASLELAERCEAAQIPCVFTSSELVFDGLNPPYKESDPVCPINLYGEQKAAAEAGMLDRCSRMLVCRMPLMFGVAPAPSFLQPFIQQLRSGQPLNLFIDEFRTPVSGGDAAAGILLMMQRRGLIHLGGKERMSRYEFGCLLAEALQLPNANLNPCRQADVPMSAPRAPDVSMDSTLAFSLGYRPAAVRDELHRLLNPT